MDKAKEFLWEAMNLEFLDNTIATVLSYIDNLYGYFYTQVTGLAVACFCLTAGIGAVKLLLGAEELNRFLTQLFLSLAMYFVMLWAFPGIMYAAHGMITQLAQGSTAGQGVRKMPEGQHYKEGEFFKTLQELSLAKGYQYNEVTEEFEPYEDSLYELEGTPRGNNLITFDIVLQKNNFISVNRIFAVMVTTFKGIFQPLMVKQSFFKTIGQLPDMAVILVCSGVYFFAVCGLVMEYVIALINYTFLFSVGVLFIPLMLWEGTKHAFEKLIGSMIAVMVRLLVVEVVLFLALYVNVDLLRQLHILTRGNFKAFQRIEIYLSLAFMSVLINMLAKAVPQIAGFLSGGPIKMNAGNFGQAAKALGASAAIVGGGIRTAANAAGYVGSNVVGAGAALVTAGHQAAGARQMERQVFLDKKAELGNPSSFAGGGSVPGAPVKDYNGADLTWRGADGRENSKRLKEGTGLMSANELRHRHLDSDMKSNVNRAGAQAFFSSLSKSAVQGGINGISDVSNLVKSAPRTLSGLGANFAAGAIGGDHDHAVAMGLRDRSDDRLGSSNMGHRVRGIPSDVLNNIVNGQGVAQALSSSVNSFERENSRRARGEFDLSHFAREGLARSERDSGGPSSPSGGGGPSSPSGGGGPSSPSGGGGPPPSGDFPSSGGGGPSEAAEERRVKNDTWETSGRDAEGNILAAGTPIEGLAKGEKSAFEADGKGGVELSKEEKMRIDEIFAKYEGNF